MSRWRLTPRGRVVTVLGAALLVAATATVILAVTAGWLGSSAGATQEKVLAVSSRWLIVEPGDTLWTIARELRPEVSTWETVRLLRETNGLSDSLIRPGQRLLLPDTSSG